ncbi:hypothetical protein EDD29_0046 [Actinocorallia herbida]|uniref:Papain like protease n=1 Tax=Actinocorallia herbida TaxID=58109 RepID=A0A3N1CMM1_9ACTN|nr:hypothetical protein [Actinocorallia herbida]ROO82566.1 hypothetical protein EDD29_0046 [Actinocorallia herbida]
MPHPAFKLGRRVDHDVRSRRYPARAADPSTLTSVRHARFVPVLDQGTLGSCTGNAAIGAIGSGHLFLALPDSARELLGRTADEVETTAVSVYATATTMDDWEGEYPPTDTGSSGLAVAKVLKSVGWISGYRHAFSLAAALTALAEAPVITGLPWYSSMFEPDLDGRLRVHRGTGPDGGHEVVLDELDVANRRVWLTNSWGPNWGVGGRAWLSWDDFGQLLAEQGDVTVLLAATEPPPVPTPLPGIPYPEDEKPRCNWMHRVGDAIRSLLSGR